MARLLVEIDESLKRDLKARLMGEGETLKEWIARMAQSYVEGEIPPAFVAEKQRREVREPQSGKTIQVPVPAAPKPAERPAPAAKKDDIFFFD